MKSIECLTKNGFHSIMLSSFFFRNLHQSKTLQGEPRIETATLRDRHAKS